jgi:Leucine Rich repeat
MWHNQTPVHEAISWAQSDLLAPITMTMTQPARSNPPTSRANVTNLDKMRTIRDPLSSANKTEIWESFPPHPVLDGWHIGEDLIDKITNDYLDDKSAARFMCSDARMFGTLMRRYKMKGELRRETMASVGRVSVDMMPLLNTVVGSPVELLLLRRLDTIATLRLARPTEDQALEVFRMLPALEALRTLDLREGFARSWIEADNTRIMSRRFPGFDGVTLASIDGKQHALVSLFFRALADSIDKVPLLERLCLSSELMTEDACSSFGRALQNAPRLRTLYFSVRKFAAESSLALALALRQAPALASLKLFFFDMTPKRGIGITVMYCHQLQELDLSENNMGREGAETLASSLRNMVSLVSLNLSWNCIDDSGCIAIAAAFRHTPLLARLSLHANNLRDDGCRSLIAALPFLPQIQVIWLGGNPWITKAAQKDMTEAMEQALKRRAG